MGFVYCDAHRGGRGRGQIGRHRDAGTSRAGEGERATTGCEITRRQPSVKGQHRQAQYSHEPSTVRVRDGARWRALGVLKRVVGRSQTRARGGLRGQERGPLKAKCTTCQRPSSLLVFVRWLCSGVPIPRSPQPTTSMTDFLPKMNRNVKLSQEHNYVTLLNESEGARSTNAVRYENSTKRFDIPVSLSCGSRWFTSKVHVYRPSPAQLWLEIVHWLIATFGGVTKSALAIPGHCGLNNTWSEYVPALSAIIICVTPGFAWSSFSACCFGSGLWGTGGSFVFRTASCFVNWAPGVFKICKIIV
jgi:hypothetical protein